MLLLIFTRLERGEKLIIINVNPIFNTVWLCLQNGKHRRLLVISSRTKNMDLVVVMRIEISTPRKAKVPALPLSINQFNFQHQRLSKKF